MTGFPVQVDPGWGTIIGGAFVMIAAFLAALLAEFQRKYDLSERKRNAKHAIGSEVAFIVRLIKEHGYIDSLRNSAKQFSYGGTPGFRNYSVIFLPLDSSSTRIYQANLQNIAFLGAQTLDVIDFYAMFESALKINIELKTMAERAERDLSDSRDGELAQLKMNGLATKLDALYSVGQRLQGELLSE